MSASYKSNSSFQLEFGETSFTRRADSDSEFVFSKDTPEAEVYSILNSALCESRPVHSGEQGAVSRGCVRIEEVSEQKFVVRKYARGGLVARINTDMFFKLPGNPLSSTRPFMEFIALGALYERGVHVPRPYALLVKSKLAGFGYQAVLATCYVEGSSEFLSLVAQEQEAAARLAGVEAAKMLDNCIFHPDLHVGNVLVCRGDGLKAFLIDFDKVRFLDPVAEIKPFQQALVSRWERSVLKRNLDRKVVAAFEAGLRNQRD